jgi:hypothetical protein
MIIDCSPDASKLPKIWSLSRTSVSQIAEAGEPTGMETMSRARKKRPLSLEGKPPGCPMDVCIICRGMLHLETCCDLPTFIDVSGFLAHAASVVAPRKYSQATSLSKPPMLAPKVVTMSALGSSLCWRHHAAMPHRADAPPAG